MKPKMQRNSKSGSKEPGLERRAWASSSKPMFTRPSSMGNYVASKAKTDSGVLHQPQTLKAPAARQRAGSHRNGRGLRHGPQTGWQHGRGERVRKDSVTSPKRAAIWPYGQPSSPCGEGVSISTKTQIAWLPPGPEGPGFRHFHL